jgi:Bacterial mobilisation protein (MobC)
MNCTEILKARVSPAVNFQVKAIADRAYLTEAAWLKRLVLREIRTAEIGGSAAIEFGEVDGVNGRRGAARASGRCQKPVFVRLREEDRPLLDARAAAQGMRPAPYVCVLMRSHLRSLTPLPKEEFLALKRSIAELASIGRNINQIAKAANEGGRLKDSVGAEFRAMLKMFVALRDNTKAFLKANEIRWGSGRVAVEMGSDSVTQHLGA